MTTDKAFRSTQRPGGFSLVEVLIAMGIFAVGFVSVAAMFPAAIVLQRQTVIDVESQLVARNAAAMVKSRKLDYTSDLGRGSAPAGLDLVAFSQVAQIAGRWTLGDRGYPTFDDDAAARQYYWVPFIRKSKDPAAPEDYSVIVFVMRREVGKTYTPGGVLANAADGPTVPKVVRVAATPNGNRFDMANDANGDGEADQVRAGDFVADNRGVIYNVVDHDATGFWIFGNIPNAAVVNAVWYSPPSAPGDPSPCTRILPLADVVN